MMEFVFIKENSNAKPLVDFRWDGEFAVLFFVAACIFYSNLAKM